MRAGLLACDGEETLRASLGYRLVGVADLDSSQRAALGRALDDPDLFGVLVPAPGTRGWPKSVCQNTARLYQALREPGRVPEDVRAALGSGCALVVARLICLGVLEVERAGSFVSGPAALDGLLTLASSFRLRGRIGELSLAGLKYGERFLPSTVPDLAYRLYRYNTAPASPRWRRRHPTGPRPTGGSWLRHPPERVGPFEMHHPMKEAASGADHWIIWMDPDAHTRVLRQGTAGCCKLYISPVARAMREAFHESLPILARAGALGFKVGADVTGILRPDKFVVYFEERAAAHDVAADLSTALAGIPAQGVPFTAGLGDDGLLSWGVDPHLETQTLGQRGGESWRLWIVRRLAEWLLSSLEIEAGIPPWQVALTGLYLEGVDPETFVPHGFGSLSERPGQRSV